MDAIITFILGIATMIVVYQHASGRRKYNKVFILIISLLYLLPALVAAALGWYENPRREQGDSWRTVL